MTDVDDCPYISYAPGRREQWKCHHTPEGIRRTIRYGSEGLALFAREVTEPGAPATYTEIPRDRWLEVFCVSA